jgi:hypothetical protein
MRPELTHSTPVRIIELAARFVADSAGARAPWPGILEQWGAQRDLDTETIAKVRAAVARERVARALGRHQGSR